MKDKDKIIFLFQKYGFDYKDKSSDNDFLVFTFKSGFFHNVELVSLNISDKENIEKNMNAIAHEFEKLGFSAKKSFYESIGDIEKILFDGFFHVEKWKEKIREEYKNHCDRILNILPKEAGEYSYIQAPYLKNNSPSSEKNIKR